ncbi:hypothetical protein BC938DRAFT_472081 [Jimgerdemannia flammicorona]|uniref:Cation efflux protein transmembrane domain-containing protein n=1 Tax=Jimgerdemannia flammicorona TaxID=994334 RepID=A0A433Q6U2_9FUNG|nr:hypothetical protein BC938DRAFT_472081 [Jimgerdemannia flammicorona]
MGPTKPLLYFQGFCSPHCKMAEIVIVVEQKCANHAVECMSGSCDENSIKNECKASNCDGRVGNCCQKQYSPDAQDSKKQCAQNAKGELSETNECAVNSQYSRSALIHLALLVCFITVIHNIVEGTISVLFGSENSSVSLLFFGIGSFVEILSAILVAWRFSADVGGKEILGLERERKTTLGVGVIMCLLSIGTIVASVVALAERESPGSTFPGIIISSVVIGIMLSLWLVKRWLARVLDSPAMRSDAKCSLACVSLSGVLLVGSLVFKVVPGAWWVDAVAALLLAFLFAKEGVEMIRYTLSKDFKGGCGCSD